MQQITSEELKQKIINQESFVLDFFATWCGPCKVMLVNLEKVNEILTKESTGTPTYGLYKFDIESDMDYMRELGIRSVPTIKIFKEGMQTFSQAGILQPDQVLALLN